MRQPRPFLVTTAMEPERTYGPDKPSRGILWALGLSALIWLPLAWAVISIVRSL